MHLRSKSLYTVYVGGKPLTVTGRKFTNAGYVSLCVLDHPNKASDGYIFEHRLIMEQKVNRFLEEGEVVHHLNEVKHDNRIDNLKLMSVKDHTILHHKGVKRPKKTRSLMSKHMKRRLINKEEHPSYKDVDEELKELLSDGVSKAEAARTLGITRKTVYNKINYLEWEI